MVELEDWEPKTKLGRMVKAGEVRDIKEVFRLGLPIMESEIIDALLPDMEEEVIDISLVQRMHKSGRRVKFRATVAIGNKDGYIGLGKATAKEVGPAIRKAITEAKLNMAEIRRGCGSWECGCGSPHSVPFEVTGKSSSVTVTLLPAPRGIGLAAGDVTKKLLKLAGVTDVWSVSKGQTQSTINFTNATFNALKKTSSIKVSEEQMDALKITEGKVEQDETSK
ncbi:MAG: 30S ribosomal protein S5 [Candidatus Hydrothermarchaeales archaeon]